MKKRERKGFTIVELVIVIAIVAVLAAIIIPTFSSLVDKANQSADIQAAKQLNDALAVGSIPDKPQSFEEVIEILAAAGFNSKDSLKPITTNYRFFWYKEENVIVLAEIPTFLDAALALASGNLPNEHRAKVWFPEGRGNVDSVAHEFEELLNRLIEILWQSDYVSADGTLNATDIEEIKDYIKTKILDDPELSSIFSAIFEHDLAFGEKHLENIEKGEYYVRITGVTLNETSLNLGVGETFELTATVHPEEADAKYKGVKWSSSDETVATVDENGLVKAKNAGTATITATSAVDDKIKASCVVTVSSIPVTGVAINNVASTRYLAVGTTGQLNAIIDPSNATNQKVTWSSSATNVATVDDNGLVTAIASGETTITVTTEDGNHTSSRKVVVIDASINAAEKQLNVGETFRLTVNDLPTNDSNVKVVWSSNNVNIATVDQNGLVTAISTHESPATITAQVMCYNTNTVCTVKCEITVNSAVEGFTVSAGESIIYVNENTTLTAHINVGAGQKTPEVEWSSSNSNITVTAGANNTATVTASQPGNATITATLKDGSGKEAPCYIEFITKITEITITNAPGELIINHPAQLEFSILPADAEHESITWNSSHHANVTVDNSGIITASKKAGSIITVTVKDKKGNTFTSTQYEVTGKSAISSISFAPTHITLITNVADQKTEKLEPVSSLAQGATTNPGFVWESLNTQVATVDENGVVTAVANGEATIKVSSKDDPTVSATCTVKVTTAVTDVTLNEISLTLDKIGATATLTADVEPGEASEKDVTWQSSNTSVATVDEDGKVTAVGVGEATITVITVDGNKTAECTVKVTDPKAVFDEDSLKNALNTQSECYLTKDVIISNPIEITKDFTIDLNGHTLILDSSTTATFGSYGITVEEGGALTITDNTKSGTFVIDGFDENETDPGGTAGICVNGTLVLNNVNIAGEKGWNIENYGDIYLTNSTFTVNAGYGLANAGAAYVNYGDFVANGSGITPIYGANSGTMNITGTTFSENTGTTIDWDSKGELTLTDVTMGTSASNVDASYAKVVIIGGEFGGPISGKPVEITDGTFKGNVTLAGNGSIISGGTFTGKLTIANSNKTTITGGTFNGGLYCETSTVIIVGGTFSGLLHFNDKSYVTINGGTFNAQLECSAGHKDTFTITIKNDYNYNPMFSNGAGQKVSYSQLNAADDPNIFAGANVEYPYKKTEHFSLTKDETNNCWNIKPKG